MEFLAEALPTIGAFALPLLHDQVMHNTEVAQANKLHREGYSQANSLHEQAIEQAEDLHQDALSHETRLHLEALEKARLQHEEGMRLDFESARRENERDVLEQRSRKAETLLIICTLMFGAYFALMIEGVLPTQTWPAFVIVFAVLSGIAFAFLMLCIFFCFRYLTLMADYNIYNQNQAYLCGTIHRTFEHFYSCHISKPARIANRCFYVGCVALMLGGGMLVFTRLYNNMDNIVAASLWLVLVVGVIVVLAVLQACLPRKTRVFQGDRDSFALTGQHSASNHSDADDKSHQDNEALTSLRQTLAPSTTMAMFDKGMLGGSGQDTDESYHYAPPQAAGGSIV